MQAGKQLEAEGIACHLVLVYRCAWGAAWLHGHWLRRPCIQARHMGPLFGAWLHSTPCCRAARLTGLHSPPAACSFVQGSAAAQSGISVVQPNVGRLHDWYNRHPGVIRDPNVSQASARVASQSADRKCTLYILQGILCLAQLLLPPLPHPAGLACSALPFILYPRCPTFCQAPTEAWAMARAGYGGEQVNPGLLLVDKIYNYVQVSPICRCAPLPRLFCSWGCTHQT